MYFYTAESLILANIVSFSSIFYNFQIFDPTLGQKV